MCAIDWINRISICKKSVHILIKNLHLPSSIQKPHSLLTVRFSISKEENSYVYFDFIVMLLLIQERFVSYVKRHLLMLLYDLLKKHQTLLLHDLHARLMLKRLSHY